MARWSTCKTKDNEHACTSDKWSTCTTKDNGYRYIRQMVDLYDKGQWVGTSDKWSTWKTKDNG